MPRDSAQTSPLRPCAPWRRHVLALFVLMLLWRGLIPEGFMPNFAALKALRWELVVCGPEWQAATARWQAQLAAHGPAGQGAEHAQHGHAHVAHGSADQAHLAHHGDPLAMANASALADAAQPGNPHHHDAQPSQPEAPAHGDAAQHRAFSCAFALAALQLIDLPPTCSAPDGVRAGWVARVPATPQASPTLWVPGPPLGSRAPPLRPGSPVIA